MAVPDLAYSGSPNANPNPASAGNSVAINFTVANIGSGAAAGSTTKIQIKPQGSTTVTVQGTFSTPAISANSSVAQSYSLTLPANTPAGTYTAFIILDNFNTAGQSNYANDQTNFNFTVSSPTLVSDLAYSGSPSASPNPAIAGNSVSVNLTIANIGSGAAAGSTTKIQIKPQGSTTITVQGTFSTPAISANSSVAQSYSLTLPANTPAGTYTAYIILDNFSTAGQSNYANDQTNFNFTVSGPTLVPDLSYSGNPSASPNPASAGSSVAINLTVANIGSGAAAGSTTKIQIKPQGSTTVTVEGTFSTPAIGANSSVTQSYSLTLPANTPAGTYTAYIILDNFSTAGQSNYTNDQTNFNFAISSSPVLVSDLSYSGTPSSSPNPANAGNPVAINLTVANIGSGAAAGSTTKIQIKPQGSTTVIVEGTFPTPAIGANSSVAQSYSLTLPANTPAGTYTAYIILDNFSTAGQSNYANDQTNFNFAVNASAVGKSDLAVVGNLSVSPSPIISGNTLTVGVTITNSGSGSAPATTTRVQVKNVSLTATVADQTFTTPAIAAGQTTSVLFGIQIPPGTTPGNYNAYLVLDSSGTGNQVSGATANDYGSSNVFAINAPTGASGISGYITDSKSGNPLSNVIVTLGALSLTTNSSGYYSFTGLVAGSYTLGASLTGYNTISTPVTLTGALQDSFQMVSNTTANQTATLDGNVSDQTTSKLLSGVTVYLINASTQVLQTSVITDSSGYYKFTSFPSGYYTVQVVLSPYQVYDYTQQFAGYLNLPIQLIPPSVSLGTSTASPKSGDPVNTATGNYIYSRTDLKLPGPGLPFQFDRNYNSQSGALGTNGPMGYGWSHSYNIQLTTDASGNVTIIWGDSKTDTYTLNGGLFTPQPGFAIFDTLTTISGGGYTLKKKDLTVYTFNSSNLLTSIVDKNGNGIQLTYTGTNLTTISSVASGRNVTLTYDANNHIIKIADPLNRTIQYSYDANGNLISVADANSNVTNYTYDASHEMLTVIDPRLNIVVTNVYDANNRVVNSQKDAKGGQTTYLYDPANKKTTVTQPQARVTVDHYDKLNRMTEEDDALGYSTRYGYDDLGNRTLVTAKNGYTVNYSYDANGNVTGKTDSLGISTSISYDLNNNPKSRTDAIGSMTSFNYDAKGNLIQAIDPLGAVTTISYNSNGQPLTVTDANTHATTSAYDSSGNLVTVTDALNKVTAYSYDVVGRKLTAKDALNHTTKFAYDNNDNVISVTDAATKAIVKTYDGNNNLLTAKDRNGNTTTYTYDAKDLLATVTDASGGVITNTYDALDQKTAVKDAKGGTTQYAYDVVGNMVSVTDALGNVTQYTYDANGNKRKTINPLSQVTQYAYDPLDRLLQTTDALGHGTTNSYDNLNRRTGVTDANGHITSFAYDPLGHLIQGTDAASGTVKYTYDLAGNRLTMAEPNGHKTTYSYDALNRLSQTVDPSGGTYAYTYDAAGNRASQADAKSQTISYAYDVDNRLTGITYPSGTPVHFTYDANGNRKGMTDGLGTSSYLYDVLNRMTSAVDAYGFSVTYGYDHNGNRTVMTYAGKSVAYAYDADNRMMSNTDWQTKITAYGYDAAGNLTGTTNPNGTTVVYGYDNAQRLVGLTNAKANATVIASYNLTLDGVGNQTQAAQNEPLSPIFTAQSTIYAYDNDNRLTAAGPTACTYDGNGNLTAKGSDAYSYDFENRLIQSTIGGVVTQYSYDGLGNRKAVVVGGVTTRYVVDINGTLARVMATKDGTGTLKTTYVYGRGLISQITAGGVARYYHYDVRGSTIGLSDSTGTLTDEYAYDPFGKVLNVQGATANPFKYVGRFGVIDEGNGLSYIRARYFSPDLGRFITKDPTTGKDGDSQSLHRYVYALNNPVRLADVSGFCAQTTNGSALASAIQTNRDIGVDLLLDFGINLTNNLKDAMIEKAATDYIFKNSLVDFLSKRGDLNAGEHAAGVGSFVDSALILRDIVKDGQSELQHQGLTIQDVGNGWLNIGANLAFAFQNPDSALDALKKGVDSTTAITINAATREASGGYVDFSFTGQDVGKATESLDFGNALFNNLHGTSVGGLLGF